MDFRPGGLLNRGCSFSLLMDVSHMGSPLAYDGLLPWNLLIWQLDSILVSHSRVLSQFPLALLGSELASFLIFSHGEAKKDGGFKA
jgi:hypothetical protein